VEDGRGDGLMGVMAGREERFEDPKIQIFGEKVDLGSSHDESLVSISWLNSESSNLLVRKSRELGGIRRYYLFDTKVLKWIYMGCTSHKNCVSLHTKSPSVITFSPSIALIV
jgi:hypothetical protein